MDFETNLSNMFGAEEEKDKENAVLVETRKTISEIEQIRSFFDSSAGKLFLSWFDEVKKDLVEQLEDCSSEDLTKIQSNIKAVKLLGTILNDKFEDLEDLKEQISRFKR